MPTFVPDEIVTAAKLNAATARDWTDWTPTLANITQGTGTVEARYIQVGKLIHAKFLFTFGASGSAMGTGPTITLPVAAAADLVNSGSPWGSVICWDATGSRHGGVAIPSSTTVLGLYAWGSATTYINVANISSTQPMTWAVSDVLGCSFTYEAA